MESASPSGARYPRIVIDCDGSRIWDVDEIKSGRFCSSTWITGTRAQTGSARQRGTGWDYKFRANCSWSNCNKKCGYYRYSDTYTTIGSRNQNILPGRNGAPLVRAFLLLLDFCLFGPGSRRLFLLFLLLEGVDLQWLRCKTSQHETCWG